MPGKLSVQPAVHPRGWEKKETAIKTISSEFTSMCRGKRPYRSRHEANRSLRHFTAQKTLRRIRGERLGTYRCRSCRFWHLGHALKRLERGTRQLIEGREPGKSRLAWGEYLVEESL